MVFLIRKIGIILFFILFIGPVLGGIMKTGEYSADKKEENVIIEEKKDVLLGYDEELIENLKEQMPSISEYIEENKEGIIEASKTHCEIAKNIGTMEEMLDLTIISIVASTPYPAEQKLMATIIGIGMRHYCLDEVERLLKEDIPKKEDNSIKYEIYENDYIEVKSLKKIACDKSSIIKYLITTETISPNDDGFISHQKIVDNTLCYKATIKNNTNQTIVGISTGISEGGYYYNLFSLGVYGIGYPYSEKEALSLKKGDSLEIDIFVSIKYDLWLNNIPSYNKENYVDIYLSYIVSEVNEKSFFDNEQPIVRIYK